MLRFPTGAAIPALFAVNSTPGPMRQVATLASYACLAVGHFTRNGDGDQAAAQNDTGHRYCAFGQHCSGLPNSHKCNGTEKSSVNNDTKIPGFPLKYLRG